MNSLIKNPSAWAPLLMSVLAIIGILTYVSIYSVSEPQAGQDEGLPARVFQLSILIQVLIIGFFAFKWVPKAPREALFILALQVIGICAAIGLIAFFETKDISTIPNIKVSEPTNFNQVGTVTRNNPGQVPEVPYLIYEAPGAPALSVKLSFDELSVCAAEGGAVPCIAMSVPLGSSFVGKRVLVEGIQTDEVVLVRKIRAGQDGEELRAFDPGDIFISWYHAIELLKDCEVDGLMQTHALDVYLDLKDGRRVRAVEPQIDNVFQIVEQTRNTCGTFPVATE